jgi:hypothetical protein
MSRACSRSRCRGDASSCPGRAKREPGPRSCKACCAPIFGNALRDSCAGSRVSFRARKGARCTRPGHETSLGSAPMPIGASSYSRCQTAHPPPLKLRRASKQARHSLGVGGQCSSFPRRVFIRGFFPSASLSPPRIEGRWSAGGGSLAFLSRLRGATPCLPCDGRAPLGAPAWRFSAARPTLHLPAVPTGIRAATSPTARRSRLADRVSRLPRRRFAPRHGTPLPRSALKASPETPRMSEDSAVYSTDAMSSQ